MTRRAVAAAALLFALGAFGVATLTPTPKARRADGVRRATDSPRVADWLRNVLLLAPAGAAAVALGLRPATAVAGGFALSLGAEAAQLAIPGRDPSLLDVAANGAGAALGALAAARVGAWLRPAPLGVGVLTLAATLAGVAVTGPLLRPAPTARPLFGHWTPDHDHLARYDAAVERATVDGLPIAHGAVTDPERLRASLSGDFSVEVEARAGSRLPEGQAALLLVTDAAGVELLLLGPDRDTLTLRYRNRGRDFGLQSTRARFDGALPPGLPPGAPLRIQARRAAADVCLTVNGNERCGLGPSVGDGWMLLLPATGSPFESWADPLRLLWMALLALPLGIWVAPRRAGWLLFAGLGAGLWLLPDATGLRPTPPLLFAASALGLGAGQLLVRGAARPGTSTGEPA